MNHFKYLIVAFTMILSHGINVYAAEKFIKIDTSTGKQQVSNLGESDVITSSSEDVVGTLMIDDDANIPNVGDFLTVETGAASFRYTTPNAGTDVTSDLEEEGQINTTAITGNASSSTAGQVIISTGDNTASWGSLDISDPDALTGLLPTSNGGTGIDSSALTGIIRVSSGTWSADAGISHLASSTSNDLLSVISDETGAGLLVFNDSPNFTNDITIDGTSVCRADGTNCPSSALTVFVTREVPSGTIDGSNKVFTLANTPDVGSEQVFLNGILRNSGGDDYTISGDTITFNDAPFAGDKILVNYRY